MVATFAPVLCKGRALETTISSFTLNANSTSVTVSNAAGYAVGTHVFSGNSIFGNADYLGKVTAKVSNTLTTSLRGAINRAASDKIWSPNVVWQATSLPGVSDYLRTYDDGIEVIESTGEQRLLTRTRNECGWITLAMRMMSVQEWEDFRDWWRTNTDSGLRTFTAAWKDFDIGTQLVAKVQREDAGRPMQAGVPMHGRRDVALTLRIVAEGTYV